MEKIINLLIILSIENIIEKNLPSYYIFIIQYAHKKYYESYLDYVRQSYHI